MIMAQNRIYIHYSVEEIEKFKIAVNTELFKIDLEDEYIDNEMALACMNHFGSSVQETVDEICRVLELLAR